MTAAATHGGWDGVKRWILKSVLGTFRGVLASRWREGGRPLWQAAALTVLLVGLGLTLKHDLFADGGEKPVANDGHAFISLEIAIDRVVWGLPSHWYVGNIWTPPLHGKLSQPGCRSRPVLSLSAAAGEAPDVARQHLLPVRNNENSLMLVDTWLLRVWPNLTVAGLIRAHAWLKVACLAVFLLFLLRAGAGLLLSFLLFQGALTLVAWINIDHPLGLYSLLLPCLLLLIACLGLILSFGLHRRLVVGSLALVFIGLLAGFTANLRTTYLLVALMVTLSAGLVACLDLRRLQGMSRRRLAVVTLSGACAFTGGFWLFNHSFIAPIQKAAATARANHTYHLVMHPLVLGLALPPSDLSQREGITWSDRQGLALARRMDPGVTYLCAGYERALLLYYLKLWIYDTSEMCHLYAAKLGVVGVHYFRQERYLPLHANQLFQWGLAAPRCLARGGWWLLVFGLIGVGGLIGSRYLGPVAAFSLTAVAAVGGLVLLESAIILPFFYIQYQNPLLFSMLCVGLLVYQLPIDGALAVLDRLVLRPPTPGSVSTGSCPSCGKAQERWFVKRGRQLCRCPDCGVVTVAEGLARTADGRSIYELDDENIFHQDGNESYYLDATNLWSCAIKLKWVELFLPAGAKLLDAGANFGHFLKVAQDRYRAVGFDLSPQAVRWSREHFAVDNHAGSIEAPPATVQGPFEGITCWDVIEHVPDPGAALASLHALLKPGGLLFLSTPDAGSLVARLLGKSWYYLDPIQHLNLFSRTNLTRLLEQAGFEVLGSRSFGRYYRLQYVIDRLAQLYPSGPLGWLGRLVAVTAWPVRRFSLYLKCGDVMGIVARRLA